MSDRSWDEVIDPLRKSLEDLIAEGDAMADRVELLEQRLDKCIEIIGVFTNQYHGHWPIAEISYKTVRDWRQE